MVDTHGNKLLSESSHTLLCSHMQHCVSGVALNVPSKNVRVSNSRRRKKNGRHVSPLEIEVHSYPEGRQNAPWSKNLDRAQELESHVFLAGGAPCEANIKIVSYKCCGIIQQAKPNARTGAMGVEDVGQLCMKNNKNKHGKFNTVTQQKGHNNT